MRVSVRPIRTVLSVAHLITSDAGMIIVDVGEPGAERTVLRRIRQLGRSDLAAIFVTHAHFDHYGAAAALRTATRAPIAIHASDFGAMARGDSPVTSGRGLGRLMVWLAHKQGGVPRARPTRADIALRDGDLLPGLGVAASVLHTPGHTDGSSCLLVDGRLAFVGDLLSGSVRPHLQRVFAVDWEQLPGSLRRLQAAKPERVYTGHATRPLRGSAVQRIPARPPTGPN